MSLTQQADNFLLTKKFHRNLARDIRQELGEQEPPANQIHHFWDFDEEDEMKQKPIDPIIILQQISEFSLDNTIKALALRYDLTEIIKSLETFVADLSKINLEIAQFGHHQTFYKSEARRLHNLKLGLITVRKCYELHPTISNNIEQETILPERETTCATLQTSPK